MIDFIEPLIALLMGGAIGYGFGMVQRAALRQNEKLEESGAYQSGWGRLPGSGRRIAILMLTLVGIQIVCPMLFNDGTQWWVSAGVALGYGGLLSQQLRHRDTGGI